MVHPVTGIFRYQQKPIVEPTSFRTEDAPAWTASTSFTGIEVNAQGVGFANFNGLVFYDFASQKNYYFELPYTALIFQLKDQIYVSSYAKGLHRLNLETMELNPYQSKDFRASSIAAFTYWMKAISSPPHSIND